MDNKCRLIFYKKIFVLKHSVYSFKILFLIQHVDCLVFCHLIGDHVVIMFDQLHIFLLTSDFF